MLSELLYIFISKSVFELYGIVINARDQVQFNLLCINRYTTFIYNRRIAYVTIYIGIDGLIERE